MKTNMYSSELKVKFNLKKLFKKILYYRAFYVMLIIPTIFLIVFNYIPIYGLIVAFKDFKASLGITGSPWVGLKNFKAFMYDPYFWKVFKNTFLFGFYSLIVGFPVPIILALMFNEIGNLRFKKFVQSISYLPSFISVVAICGMLTTILSPSTGVLNNIMAMFGMHRIYFLTEPKYFMSIYVLSGIWQTAGMGTILYLAAIAGIDTEQYEAAVVDGANRLQKIYHITFPALLPVISIMLIFSVSSVIGANFEKILLLYNEVTYDVSDVLGTYMYRRALLGGEFSIGTAMGLFNMVINLVLVCVCNTVAKHTENASSLW